MREDSSLTEKNSFLAVNQHLRSKKTRSCWGKRAMFPRGHCNFILIILLISPRKIKKTPYQSQSGVMEIWTFII